MQIETGLWEVSPQDRIRIVLRYQGSLYPIFWFKFGKDGSIYLGPRLTEISVLKLASKVSNEGTLSFKYAEGEEVPLESVEDPIKISVHSSGVVHAGGKQTWTDTLRGITKEQFLCFVLFRQISNYTQSDSVRKRDVVLDYPIDEERPLLGQLTVAPIGAEILVPPIFTNARHQLNLLFNCSGLEMDPSKIQLRLVLWHGLKGPWPPYSCLIWRNSDKQRRK